MRTLSLVVTLAILVLGAAPMRGDTPGTPTVKTASRTGIPYKTDDEVAGDKELVDTIRARRPGGKLIYLDRVLLHSPAFAKGWNGMFAAIRGQLTVPARLRETAIMAISALNHSDYEWTEHEPLYLKAGGSKDQLAALKAPATALKSDKLFDETERAALALAGEMTRDIKVSDATMKRIRKALPDDQVVELIGTIAAYNMVSRFVVAAGVELE